MSDAAFTDSTTPRLENWRTVAPFSGSSTKTTSPSCSWAKCVMPMVATSPSARTHSCSLEYLRSLGTVLTPLPSFCTSGSLRSPPAVSSLRSSTVKGCLDYRSGNVLAADADGEGCSDLRKRRRDVRQRDVLSHGGSVGPARHVADDLPVLCDLVAVTSDAALHDKTGDFPLRPRGLLRRDHVAARELFVELARPAEPRLDRVGGLVDVIAVEGEARLEAQRVARAQADGLDPGAGPGREQPVPDRGRVGVGHKDLEAVLARVARARQRRLGAGDAAMRHAKGRERLDVDVGLLRKDVRRARPLDRDEGRAERPIVERDVLVQMSEDVRAVLRDVRRVH